MGKNNEKTASVEDVEKSEGENLEYPAAKLMLSIAQKEYEYEVDRKKTLETRAGIFVAFTGVVLTFLSNNLKTSFFKSIGEDQFILYATIFAVFFVIPIILLLVALYSFVHVIITKPYTRIELKDFNDSHAKLKEDVTAVRYAKAYVKIVSLNSEKNNKKTKYFNTGVICTSISSVLLILFYFITFSLNGG
jgi:hypothetical protein